MKLPFVVYVFMVAPAAVFASELDFFNLITDDQSIWKCVADLDDECVDSLGKKPVEELLMTPELRFGNFLSIEKVSNGSFEQRDVIQNVWDLEELMNAGFRYLTNHALKLKFGDIEARMFKSKSKPESLELTVEARKRSTGKSQKIYRVIIPLVIGFKITGLVIFGIVTVKIFLLKASLIANTALLVAGGIVLKKLYDHGMGMLNQHQALLTSHPTPNYYSNNHDFSGYGYNSYSGNGFEENSNSIQHEGTGEEPPLGEIPDLHGQFSNHAIAMAALNRTLMQQQQQLPKRRWSNRWSPWSRHR